MNIPLAGRWFLESGTCLHEAHDKAEAPSEALSYIGTLYQEAMVIHGGEAKVAKLLRTGLGPTDFCSVVAEYQAFSTDDEVRLEPRKILDRQGSCESSPLNRSTILRRVDNTLRVHGMDPTGSCTRILFVYRKVMAPSLHSSFP